MARLKTYTVHEKPDPQGGVLETRLIPDGVTWIGLVIPAVWAFWHRLYIEALALVAAAALIAMGGEALGLHPALTALFGLTLNVWVFLDGADLRRGGLTRDKWVERAAVRAPDLAEAERQWFGRAPDVRAGSWPGAAAGPPPAAL